MKGGEKMAKDNKVGWIIGIIVALIAGILLGNFVISGNATKAPAQQAITLQAGPNALCNGAINGVAVCSGNKKCSSGSTWARCDDSNGSGMYCELTNEGGQPVITCAAFGKEGPQIQ